MPFCSSPSGLSSNRYKNLMPTPKDKILQSYDKIAEWFDKTRSRDLMERPYLELLTEHLQDGATILDLGCGTGEPIMRFLLQHPFKVTGVDGSSAMIKKAQQRFPEATFILSDMRHIALDQRFDAIIAWHSFFHLPPSDQKTMFKVFAKHLKPKGWLLFTTGNEAGECFNENHGENLYHASLNAADYTQLLTAQNLQVVKHVADDPECGSATVWLACHDKAGGGI